MALHYKNTCLVSREQLNTLTSSLSGYVEQLQSVVQKNNYEHAESSINLPADANMISAVQSLARKFSKPRPKYIIDIGIGGSNLGTKAIYDALVGFYDQLEPGRYPKMFFADTNNPIFLAKLYSFIMNTVTSPDEIMVNAISKSGGTTETTVNMEIIAEALVKKFGKAGLARLVITSGKGSKFWKGAEQNGLATLPLPDSVGGRYSVFSTVGMFPLAVAGFDIQSIAQGALEARNVCIDSNPSKNLALLSAVILYASSKQGKTINDNFIFNQELESVGKWYRQLMGESIGKEHDLDGNVVHAGITPTVSIGSTDLHSVGQLYLGGPRDKITTFISAQSLKSDAQIPSRPLMPDLVESIYGKNASDIMGAILVGVKAAYQKQSLPFMEVVLDDISERSLGRFMQFKMIEMMYLGKLLNVNTFDQPHVELYKIETKKALKATQ